jgi:hypothetical protein
MTITELINKLQQLRMESGDINVLTYDESEGAFNVVQSAFLSYPDSDDDEGDDDEGIVPIGVILQ